MALSEQEPHAACVDAWLERAASAPGGGLLDAFQNALEALWRRTHVTLGDVTLAAIGDRVLHAAADAFPAFASLGVDPSGRIQSQELRDQAPTLPETDLRAGIRFVLVEFLTVLGNLTSEILTPALHAELARVAAAEPGPEAQPSPRTARWSRSKEP